MLFHFGHPFGKQQCVMIPVSMLRFREWYEKIDVRAGPIGSDPAMKPGAIKITY